MLIFDYLVGLLMPNLLWGCLAFVLLFCLLLNLDLLFCCFTYCLLLLWLTMMTD